MSGNIRFKIPTVIGVCIVMALFLSLVSGLDWLEFAEFHVLRSVMFIQSKYFLKKETSQKLALIRIDRKSEEMLGNLPWGYEILTPLCKILKKSEANAIGLFVQFERLQKIEGCDNLFTIHQSQKSGSLSNLENQGTSATRTEVRDFGYHLKNTGFINADLYPENGIYKAKLIEQGRYPWSLC